MIGQSILTSSRWMLLLTVVLAAWLWGGTRPWTNDVVCWLLLADTSLFIAGLLAARRLPRIPTIAASAIAMLLLQGWLLTWSSPAMETGSTIVLSQHGVIFPSLPAFLDRAACTHTMLMITGLLGAFCMACDLSANRLWRIRLWITIAGTGASIVALGLTQRVTNAPAIFWNMDENTGTTFFAVFRYHANAGAFINLMIPLLAGLAVLGVMEEWGQAWRVFWIVSALAALAAIFVNVSRGAMVVTGIMIVTGVVSLWFLTHRRSHTRVLLISAATLLAAVVLLAWSLGVDASFRRWQCDGYFDSKRYLTDQVIVQKVLPQTGLLGSGPGTFEPVFASVVKAGELPVRGRWDKAHNDHLQTIVEWGWIGYICWAVLLLGGVWRGASMARLGMTLTSRSIGFCGALALEGVLLHATVDFPLQIASIQLCTALIAGILWGK